MSWLPFGSKAKTNAPSQTNLHAHRAKQIDSLKKVNPNVIETITNVEFRVPVLCGGNNITLIVSLPPQFPQDPPSVTVQPPVYHPWVDHQQKVIGCSNLNSFSMHTSLGNAVQAVVEEFKRNPPKLQQLGYGPPMSYPGSNPSAVYRPPEGYPFQTNLPPPPPQPSLPPTLSPAHPQTSSPQTVQMDSSRVHSVQMNGLSESSASSSSSQGIPDINTAFPELKSKSLSQLNELLNEEDKVLEMIQNLPEVVRLAEDREKLSNECIVLARDNLSKKPSVQQLKQWVSEKHTLFTKMREEFEKNQERLMSKADQFHPSNIQTNLKVALMESEESSENIVQEFLDKKISIEEFSSRFMQERKLFHSRRAKEEKLNQIIMHHGY